MRKAKGKSFGGALRLFLPFALAVLSFAFLTLPLSCAAQPLADRGRTTPDDGRRWHALCLVSRPPFSAWAGCRSEDAPRAGFENFYRLEVLSPWLRLDVPERFEAAVTVAALPDGRMRFAIAGWGELLLYPLDAEMRAFNRAAAQVATKDGHGLETIVQGVTVTAAGDGQYTVVIDHIGRCRVPGAGCQGR